MGKVGIGTIEWQGVVCCVKEGLVGRRWRCLGWLGVVFDVTCEMLNGIYREV